MDPITQSARRLDEALITAQPIGPVRNRIGPTDIDSAYRVQHLLNSRREARGARRVGRKIGLTSPAVQRQLGVDQPDFGVLFEEMQVGHGAVIEIDSLIAPKVEAEVAFELTAGLPGVPTLADVTAAVGTVWPALEIVDSRIRDWDIEITDTVADNGSAALFVLGPSARSLKSIRPAEVSMTMTVDDREASAGSGSDCLGDPLNALAWLARRAAAVGDPLRAGDIVLSGALGPMVPVTGGEHVSAVVAPLGTVAVQFSHRKARRA